MDNIIKIVDFNWFTGLWIDGAIETLKNEIKQESGYLDAMMEPMVASLIEFMVCSLIQPKTSSLINNASRKGVMRAGK